MHKSLKLRTFKIYAAHARSKTEFAIALQLSPRDAEDMFSIVLTYNADTPQQPWSRDDMQRPISSLTVSNIDESKRFAALSSEGDIYHVSDTENYIYEKIDGAGLYSADAKGYGATTEIVNIDGTLFVTGLGQQLYKRNSNEWQKIDDDIFNKSEAIKNLDFKSVGGKSSEVLYVAAIASMNQPEQNIPKELIEADKAARKARDREAYRKIKAEIRKFEKPHLLPQGRGYYYVDNAWAEIDVEDELPRTVFIDSKDQIWFGGEGNCTLIQVDEDGDIDPIEIDEDGRGSIYSITEFKTRLIIASDYGLFAYDENFDLLEDEIVRIKPKLNKKIHSKPSPLKVQAVEDVMYYFDYNLGVYIWDGDKTWTNIPIPPELLERDFKGLK